MLWEALTLKQIEVEGKQVEVLRVVVKGQKQVQGRKSSTLDLHPSSSILCPVKAYKEAKPLVTKGKEPVARWSSGTLITTSFMNKFLKNALNELVDWDKSPITTHSFRAGLPTLLSSIGEQDGTIKDVGRWSSSAYELYKKDGSKNAKERAKLFRRIGNALL